MPGEILKATLHQVRSACALTLALCAGIFNAHSSDVIATAELSGGGGGHFIGSSVQLFVRNGGVTNGSTATVFDSFVLTPDEVGQVFSLDQSVDPDFNLFTSRLTNGVNDQITRISRLSGGGSSGLLASEASFFSTRPPGGNGIDLTGFTIDRIDVKINELSIASPGTDQAHDGIWTDYSIQATLSFIGSPIPEPAGVGVFFAALALMRLFRRPLAAS